MQTQPFTQTHVDAPAQASSAAPVEVYGHGGAESQQAFVVTYRLNPDDFHAAQWHYVQTSPSIRRNYRIIFTVSLMLVAGLTAMMPLTGVVNWMFAVFFFVIFAGFWTWKWPANCRDGVRRQTDKLLREGRNALLRGNFRMEVDVSGVRVTTELGDSRLAWDAVEGVDETDAHVFVRVGSTALHVVPKWAFESRCHAEEFVAAARHFHRRAEFS